MRARLLVAVVLFVACRSTHPQREMLRGTLVDPDGKPVVGAEVRIDERTLATTDSDGAFAVPRPARERVAVTFREPRFATTTNVYEGRAAGGGINTVVIWPRAAAQRVRGSEGGTLTFPGATISIPPGAFVDARGRRVAGDVDVALTALDISDERQIDAAPGDFTARMRDGSIRPLETFGLFELVAASDGRAVQLAADQQTSVNVSTRSPQEQAPFFRFDALTGRWIEAGLWISGRPIAVSATGWWNVDQPFETTCINVELRGCKHCDNGTIATTATVEAHPKGFSGAISSPTTINNGVACLFVKKSAQVILKVIDAHTAYQVEVDTPSNVASVCDGTCPLVVTHTVGAPLNNAPLDSGWCATDGANNSPFNTVFSSSSPNTIATASNVTLKIEPCNSSNCSGKGYVSGEYKTDCFHGYGTYKATIDPPQKPTTGGSIEGLVTGFFTFTDGSDGTTGPGIADWHDEVDIELVGRDPHAGDYLPGALNPGGCTSLTNPMVVHTNYFTKKPWKLSNQRDYCIPYGTHNYEFDWTATHIEWRYDGIVLRKVMRTDDDWPTQPGRLYLNLWGTDGTQAGSFAGAAYNFTPSRTATFSNISTP